MSARTRLAVGAAAWFAGALVLTLAPIGAYTATLATEVIILSLWAVSYNLVYGYMGEISFGHAAFFGLGAFGVPLLARDLGLPFALDLVGGMLVAGLFAAVVSFVIRRTRGVYYAVLTFALSEMLYVIAIKWTSFSGGDNGLPVARPALLNSPVRYALFALVVVSIAIAALHRIVNSPAGRVVQAIRQNERRARQIGYNTTAYRALAFILSGTFSGLAGALYSPFIHFVSPDVLFWTFSGQVIIMTIIGGAGAFYGPVSGAVLFVVLRDFVSSWSASSTVIGGVAVASLGEHWPLFMGLVFFFIILFEPEGLAGILARFPRARMFALRRRP
jgi:ABC-type branched-subunit amino acid transport system permease subunit